MQLEGGGQGVHLEAHAGVLQARRFQREQFQRCQVAGDDAACILRQQCFNQALRQCRAFVGVGAAAQLVDQHQRVGGGVAQHVPQVLEVRSKGGEAGLDALLVADVHQNVPHHREFRRGRRHEHPALVHQHGQAQRFEGRGLAAHVRPGDQQQLRLAELEVVRHGVLDQRVTPLAHVVHTVPAFLGAVEVPVAGQFRLAGDQIQFADGGQGHGHVRVLRQQARQFDENPPDLGFFIQDQAGEFVVQLRDRGGFHEVRLPGRGGIHDDALHAADAAGQDGQHVTVTANRDQVLLKHVRPLLQRAAELVADASAQRLDASAQVAQLVAGVIAHVAFTVKR